MAHKAGSVHKGESHTSCKKITINLIHFEKKKIIDDVSIWINMMNTFVLVSTWCWWPGGVSTQKCCINIIGIPMLKIRRSCDRLIFNMGIPIPGKTVFILRHADFRMMMSWQWNPFCITGPLWGETNGQVNSPLKGTLMEIFMFSLLLAWNVEHTTAAANLRCHGVHVTL